VGPGKGSVESIPPFEEVDPVVGTPVHVVLSPEEFKLLLEILRQDSDMEIVREVYTAVTRTASQGGRNLYREQGNLLSRDG